MRTTMTNSARAFEFLLDRGHQHAQPRRAGSAAGGRDHDDIGQRRKQEVVVCKLEAQSTAYQLRLGFNVGIGLESDRADRMRMNAEWPSCYNAALTVKGNSYDVKWTPELGPWIAEVKM